MLIAVLCFSLVAKPFYIPPTSSMMPGLHVGATGLRANIHMEPVMGSPVFICRA
jgi:hypothetical protein